MDYFFLMRYQYLLAIIFLPLLVVSCSISKKAVDVYPSVSITGVRLLNVKTLPSNLMYKDVKVGGLSSIDYDAKQNVFYAISDDPGALGPTRFYELSIPIHENGIDTVLINSMHRITGPGGQAYSDVSKDRFHSADDESMRYDAVHNLFVRGTEGQRIKTEAGVTYQNPEVVTMDKNGHFVFQFKLADNMQYHTQELGPRHNSVFEGLSYSLDNKYVYVSVEDALYEDGNGAGLGDSTGYIRIMKLNRKHKKQVAQYAYIVDPVQRAPQGGSKKINGVTDILAYSKNTFLVTERSWSIGKLSSDIRVYMADFSRASNVARVKSLLHAPNVIPIEKKLLINFSNLGIYVDNVEGASWGPVLPNGHKTLLFVTDNDFLPERKMQFYCFEIIP